MSEAEPELQFGAKRKRFFFQARATSWGEWAWRFVLGIGAMAAVAWVGAMLAFIGGSGGGTLFALVGLLAVVLSPWLIVLVAGKFPRRPGPSV